MAIRFHRVGADPEYVIAVLRGATWELVSANEMVQGGRGTTLFMGTDGHSTTAEVRPSPVHNVDSMLVELAYGLTTAYDGVRKTRPTAEFFARPKFLNEPCGGHIHASFFTKDDAFQRMLYDGQIVNQQEAVGFLHGRGLSGLTSQTAGVWDVADVKRKENEGAIPTPFVVAKSLAYLLGPLEYWVQPWGERVSRNTTYGRANEIRYGDIVTRPESAQMAGWSYLKYEYRTPSTWLHSPLLAYLYIGMAKLVMLNLPIIGPRAMKASFRQGYTGESPGNPYFKEALSRRLEWVRGQTGVVITPDLRRLSKAVELVEAGAEAWWRTPSAMDIPKWRELR